MTPEQKFDLQRKFARAAARVKPILKFGSDVVEKVPRPGDTWSVLAAKGLALANAAFEANSISYDPHRELADQEKLTAYVSHVFVEMFFRPGGGILEQFNLRKVPVPGNEIGVEARSSAGALFLFREEAGPAATRTASNVFHGPGLEKFRAVREGLWGAHPHGIYLSLRKENMWSNPAVSFERQGAVPAEHLSAQFEERLQRILTRHLGNLRDGVPRSYLLFGPPGTGKSTFACRFGQLLGGRVLKMDPDCLALMGAGEFCFLMEALAPDVVVLDDVDRAPLGGDGAKILYLMERVKVRAPRTALVLTVNDPKSLDHALLRSDRIDEAIEFATPSEEEMTQMAAGMCHRYGAPPEMAPRVAAALLGNGMGHAYVNDFCRRLRRESFDEALASIQLLHRLSLEAKGITPVKPQAVIVNAPAPGELGP